ncbi:hypothetical protein ACA910_000596 [Epithemia clementina (nom. ined.)]
MRRNCIYRSRNLIGTFLDIALPVGFVGILLAIKGAVDNSGADIVPAIYPDNSYAFRPFSFQDYITAVRAEKQCEMQYDGNGEEMGLGITGINQQGYNWMVPMVKCDNRPCEFVGQNASTFCEYAMIAVSGTDDDGLLRAADFRTWTLNRYPELLSRDMPYFAFEPDFDPVKLFNSSDAINSYVRQDGYGTTGVPKIMMGIVWEGNDANNYQYRLRLNQTNFNNPKEASRPGAKTAANTAKVVDSYSKNDFSTCVGDEDGLPEQGPLQDSCTGKYMYNGVLTIQRLVGDYILDRTGAASSGYAVSENGVVFVQFPTSAYEEQGFYGDLGDYGPILIALGLLYPVASIIGYISREKEQRQKELMKMMSVTEAEIGWSWFISFVAFHFVNVVLCTVVSSALYENSDGIYLFEYWLLTFWSVINFCSAIAAFTSRSTVAILVGILVFFVGVFLPVAYDYQDGEEGLIGLISLHPVAAFGFGMQEIGFLEDQGTGVTEVTFDTSEHPSGYSFQNTLRSLFVCAILWGALSAYLNRVVRQDYGQSLPWFFPCSRTFWCPAAAANEEDAVDEIEADQDVPYEPVSDNLKRQREEGKSIEIRNLYKSFGDKVAVNGLSLSMYSGQITALLGHNGAGKTTTINILTGAMAATKGTAIVAGKNVKTHLQDIREDLGICLQHDCLFPMLTVREHVQFFSRIKGVYQNHSYEEAEALIDQALRDVALMEKRNSLSKNLSGGMKRKLSVAIAFCGGSKVVLLDEPTSGMDPFSRRFTWNVIRQYRQDRCIILTTHFMDEADILGDSIAIMAEGELRCCGSSLFLKKTYGVGYQLTIERHKTDKESTGKLKDIVKSNVREASLLSDVGTELSYQLPIGASANFAPIFESLDKEVEAGSVYSYGVSITTLDEVFLLVARGGSAAATSKRDYVSSVRQDGEPAVPELDADKSARSKMDLTKDGLFNTHLVALFKKRAAYFRRDKKAWCCTTILPSFMTLIGFIIYKLVQGDNNYEALTLSLSSFNTAIETAPSNPVVYNDPVDTYTCQPGLCAYQYNETVVNSTAERYFFCGGQAQINDNCSIGDSSALIEYIGGNLATAVPATVSDTLESSLFLNSSRAQYPATQYGAVFYSHDVNSVLSLSESLYSNATIEQCLSDPGNYSNPVVCRRFGGIGYTIQYNYTALHVSPLFQGLADEALVRRALGTQNFSATVVIDPLPITATESSFADAEAATALWLLMVVSFPFIGGAYASFVVAERESKAKHLQTVAGVQPMAYWLSTLLWDTLNYQFPCWFTVVFMYIFDVSILTTSNRNAASGIIILLVVFGPAAAAFSYSVSFAFKSPAYCSLSLIVFGFLIALGGPLTIFILLILGKEDPNDPRDNLTTAANVLTWILRFSPTFCLGNGVFKVINIESYEYLEGEDLNAWSEQILMPEVLFLVGETVLYMMLTLQLEKWSTNPKAVSGWNTFLSVITFRWLCKRSKEDVDITTALPDDDDVLAEQERVLSGQANNDLIVLSQLTKVYDNMKIAVNNMSLGIPPGECFGLLGVNGAGKTTTMSMLTAEFPPTSGDATLAGFSVSMEPEKTRRRIGYCPQFDAHLPNLTGREHVELYAAVKGIPKQFLEESVVAKLNEVGLSESDADRLAAGYSGGMKRRLSLACATIGQPQIVFLDECSTGVDPVARREIWQLISDMVAGGNIPEEERTSVILTTHSMEECEALCPRIGIMANGRLRCLGSAQHLKNKFGQGYQVEMKVKLVNRNDEDYVKIRAELSSFKGTEIADGDVADEGDELAADEGHEQGAGAAPKAHDVFFNLSEVKAALDGLSGDDTLSSLVSPNNPTGYNIWRNASGGIQPLDELAVFCASELRMRKVEQAIQEQYPNSLLRERQDNKARYEVASQGVRISSIFAFIEANKETLMLSDYGVSQTSLEQVFNMHAAEAEKLKQGRDDR